MASNLWLEAVRKRRDPHLNPTPTATAPSPPTKPPRSPEMLFNPHPFLPPARGLHMGPQSAYHRLREEDAETGPPLPGAKGHQGSSRNSPGRHHFSCLTQQLLRDVSPTPWSRLFPFLFGQTAACRDPIWCFDTQNLDTKHFPAVETGRAAVADQTMGSKAKDTSHLDHFPTQLESRFSFFY